MHKLPFICPTYKEKELLLPIRHQLKHTTHTYTHTHTHTHIQNTFGQTSHLCSSSRSSPSPRKEVNQTWWRGAAREEPIKFTSNSIRQKPDAVVQTLR